MDSKIIALTGFMGCGKTTVGRALALRTGLPFLDLDRYIEEVSGKRVSEIFSESGEKAFRDLESSSLAEILASRPALVLALGGGTILREENVGLLKEHSLVIYLKASFEVLESRLSGTGHIRPLLDGHPVRELIEGRLPIYEKVADIVIDTDRMTPDEVIMKILCYICDQDGEIIY